MNRNRADEIQVLPERAKHLRLGESGVFHALPSAAANDDGRYCAAVPERCPSTQSATREARQQKLKELARRSIRADGLNQADVAAACDRSRPHVTDMLSPDGRNMAGDDVIALALLSPTFAAGLVEMFRRGK